MSAELARRLVHSGAAPAQVEEALVEAIRRGVSLTQAVHELHPELVELLERALDRSDSPSIYSVRPIAELVRALPPGMCERLLALPVNRDSRSERVDIASVDVLDGHVASEFAFHLRVPIRVLRAPFGELVDALRSLQAAGIFSARLSNVFDASASGAPPEAGEPAVLDSEPASEPPILLVKRARTLDSSWLPDAPSVSFDSPWPSVAPSELPEPVLSLRRSKPFMPAETELGGPPWSLEFEAAVALLESAESPEQVVSGLCEGLAPVRALIFAVRNTSFDVRGGSAALGPPSQLRAISVPVGSGSLLDAATRAGFYWGPFAQLAGLTSLEGKWAASPGSDCYARTVNVSERPSLILLMAGFKESTEATRRADVLSRSAGAALERIVRTRKKG